MTQMSQSKDDFDRQLVIIVDHGKVSKTTLKKYIRPYEEMGIITILKIVAK